jgi:predicted HAD superfamily Cof-like phosphohydrolase
MQEELNEYCEAVLNQDLEKQFDALIDLVYVALGTAYMQGFQFDVGFDRVHEANMQKVRAKRKEDSLRGSTYDVIKPKNWAPASLKDLVGGSDDTAA